MAPTAKSILRAALALPSDQRANIAAELLDSLEDAQAMDADSAARLWALEIERRAKRALETPEAGEPWESVRERTARNLKNQ